MPVSSSEMCEGRLFKKIILYTVPIILTGVLQLLFNAADLVVVGRFGENGNLSVAAVGATGALINLIVNLFIGLSVGAGVCVAHALGARRDDDVHKVIHTAIPTALICGIFITVVGVCFSRSFLQMMGTPENVVDLSAVYMKIYFGGVISTVVYNYGAAILRAAGDTKSPLYYLTGAGIINVILNIVFVAALKMDVAGVALATVISQTIAAVLVIMNLCRRGDCCRLDLHRMKIYGRQLRRIIFIGLPAGLQGALFSISNVIIQSSVNSFGDVVLSGNSAAQSIEGFVWTTMNSFSQTSLNFTGQNYGAGKYKRIGRIAALCLVSVSAAGLIFGNLAYLFGRQLLSIYIPDSPESIEYGLIRIMYICAPYFLCGIMDVVTGVIRGMGSSITPMIITVLGVCGMRIGWIYTIFQIPKYHTLESLYISYPISWAASFLVQLLVFFIIYFRTLKKARLKNPAEV